MEAMATTTVCIGMARVGIKVKNQVVNSSSCATKNSVIVGVAVEDNNIKVTEAVKVVKVVQSVTTFVMVTMDRSSG